MHRSLLQSSNVTVLGSLCCILVNIFLQLADDVEDVEDVEGAEAGWVGGGTSWFAVGFVVG
jgi:hypothetical protein